MVGKTVGIFAAASEREFLRCAIDTATQTNAVDAVGHQADGSSIQNHSCGSHYPYIVGKQEGQIRPWFIMDPSGEIKWRFMEASVAFETAEHFARRRAAKATMKRICEQGGHHG